MNYNDSLSNLVSGLGTDRDKSTHLQYSHTQMDIAQLDNAYRSDWIAGKIIDIPAEDATREWRAWQAEADQISTIEKVERQLGIQQKTLDAMIAGRLYGGAIIIFHVEGTGAWDTPLDPSRTRRGALKYAHVIERSQVGVTELIKDPLDPYYGHPEFYQLTSREGMTNIHPSRVVRFLGKKLPRVELNSDGWGDSILQRVDQAVKDAGLASQGISSMINEATVDVIRIPDFMQNISTAEYRSKVIERFKLAMISKSINRALMLDKEEEWERKQTNFAQLPELLSKYLQIASGAADISATRFLGQSPSGLNATGESDLINYYDSVAAIQKNRIEPSMSVLDECIIRSALGDRPEDVHYNWRPLWQMTQSQKAEVTLKKSQAVANYANAGLIDESMAIGIRNMLIEDGTFPGMENEEESDIDEEDEEVKEQFDRQSKIGKKGK
jgi:phage-related protein (TIGR01555 family)